MLVLRLTLLFFIMRRRLYLFYLYTENITYDQIELYLRRKSSCFLPKNQTDRAG